MPKPPGQNTLFYGDNLTILRDYLPDACVDLIYLDPPFNSNRSYNVLFKEESGEEAEAQITKCYWKEVQFFAKYNLLLYSTYLFIK